MITHLINKNYFSGGSDISRWCVRSLVDNKVSFVSSLELKQMEMALSGEICNSFDISLIYFLSLSLCSHALSLTSSSYPASDAPHTHHFRL